MNTRDTRPMDENMDISAVVLDLEQRAKAAAPALAVSSSEQRNLALKEAALAVRAFAPEILAANARDLEGIQGGGSESLHSSRVIVDCLAIGLRAAGLPEDAVQRADTRDRQAVKLLLQSTDHVDLITPRGGRGLVSLVQK